MYDIDGRVDVGRDFASSARNGSNDFKATSDRFGRLTQIQIFSPGGIVRYARRIKNLETVANGTQLRALNSPADSGYLVAHRG